MISALKISALKVFSEYMQLLEKPVGRGLGVKIILGYPVQGRTIPTFPLGALIFQRDDYVRGGGGLGETQHRIGQIPPAGYQIEGRLYLFANHEQELLDLVDRMRAVKACLAKIEVDGKWLIVRYDATEREPFSPEEDTMFNHAVFTPVRFLST